VLQQVCEHLHNFFIRSAHPGNYTIADGTLSLPFLKDGQRFWITGSDLNDGVYTYYADGITNDDDTEVAGLRAESFNGTICAMAVPPAAIALSGEIKNWVEKFGAVIDSPYQSESFNGYSYSKASAGETGGPGWQTHFKSRLDPWRKVSL